jgi:hypothetical protein
VIEGLHFGKDRANLGSRQDHGQLELGVGANQLQLGRPLALERLFPKELESADELGSSLASDLLNRLEVDAVLADLFEGDQLRRTVVMLAQLVEAGVIGLLSAGTDRQKLQIIGEGF